MNTHIRKWHITAPPGGQNGATATGAVQQAAIEPNTVNSAVSSPAAEHAAADAKFARANLGTSAKAEESPSASEEIATLDVSASSVTPAEPEGSQTANTKSKLELAIDRCAALGDKSDTMISEKWNKRAAPILAESLSFLAEYTAATEANREAVRARLKAKSGVSRQPNIDNLPLIAVYMCVSCADKARTKTQRKAWGRFKTVVAVAAAVPVIPDGAAQWLEKKTLNSILGEWRDMQKADGKIARKSPVPKMLRDYTHLAQAFAEGSDFQTLAREELAKADAAIAKAMEAMAGAPMTAAVQVDGEAADA